MRSLLTATLLIVSVCLCLSRYFSR